MELWTHKKVDKITSPYSALVTPQYQVIIDYLRGAIAQPDPNIAGMGLTSFANSLKIENCITRPGVIASLTDPEYGEISNRIPRILYLEPFQLHITI